jgi:hypothetical protein
MTNTSSVPRRVLYRALLGIGRNTRSLLLATGVVAALIGYVAFAAPSTSTTSAQSAPPAPDCADAVMAAVVGRGASAVQHQAYQCMDADMQQRVFQEGFATQYRTIAGTAVSKVSRVGTHNTEAGDELVYYAVDAGEQSVGFVVHLSPDGKVTTIN